MGAIRVQSDFPRITRSANQAIRAVVSQVILSGAGLGHKPKAMYGTPQNSELRASFFTMPWPARGPDAKGTVVMLAHLLPHVSICERRALLPSWRQGKFNR